MNKGINIQSPSFATHYLRMIPEGNDIIMSTGTGFFYEYKDEVYLITNGHNVTRTNPEQNQRITYSAAFPVKIKTKMKYEISEDTIGFSDLITINLYEDELFKNPIWYVHPKHGYLVDVIAIPFESIKKSFSNIKMFPINKFSFDEKYEVEVSDEVFIIGYPFDITSGKDLPIWKRGTIATEPNIDLENLPKIFVDTASRSGMSGSPVIFKRVGLHGYDGVKMKGNETIGTITNFVGVYSGRIGAEDEFKAQLGIIWKKEVIEEIIEGKTIGSITFQNI
jgi:hypothetical protein